MIIRRTKEVLENGNTLVMIKKSDKEDAKFIAYESTLDETGVESFTMYDNLDVLCSLDQTARDDSFKRRHDLNKIVARLNDNYAVSKHYIGERVTKDTPWSIKSVVVFWKKGSAGWGTSRTMHTDSEQTISTITDVLNTDVTIDTETAEAQLSEIN